MVWDEEGWGPGFAQRSSDSADCAFNPWLSSSWQGCDLGEFVFF